MCFAAPGIRCINQEDKKSTKAKAVLYKTMPGPALKGLPQGNGCLYKTKVLSGWLRMSMPGACCLGQEGGRAGETLVQSQAWMERILWPPGSLPLLSTPPPPSSQSWRRLTSSVTHSVRLPSCQNRGCLFHSGSQSTREGGRGFNACVWTQAIIPNYCFSFELASPAGEPADEHALILPSRLISVGFVGQAAEGGGLMAFISMWV